MKNKNASLCDSSARCCLVSIRNSNAKGYGDCNTIPLISTLAVDRPMGVCFLCWPRDCGAYNIRYQETTLRNRQGKAHWIRLWLKQRMRTAEDSSMFGYVSIKAEHQGLTRRHCRVRCRLSVKRANENGYKTNGSLPVHAGNKMLEINKKRKASSHPSLAKTWKMHRKKQTKKKRIDWYRPLLGEPYSFLDNIFPLIITEPTDRLVSRHCAQPWMRSDRWDYKLTHF